MDWKRGWPDSDELPEGLKRPSVLPEGIIRASASGDDLAWAGAYPTIYRFRRGPCIAQYENCKGTSYLSSTNR